MVTVHREVEKKYVADDRFELPPLAELVTGTPDGPTWTVAPLAEGDLVRERLGATYFDTADLRLAAAGLTLRRRTGGDDAGWHLKVPVGADTRSEVRLPLGRGPRTVPAALQQLVWAHSRGAALEPVAEILTDRTVRRLVDVTGHVVAEFADDRVTARRLMATDGLGDAAGLATSWREIEVELGGDETGLLATVDARLRERGLQEAPTTSKLAHVLGVQRSKGNGSGKAKKLSISSSGGEAVLVHIREQVQQILAQDLPVRLDVRDSIHKMRVATRRLRSALTTFKPLFTADVVRPLREELKWLAGELGAARDAEVMRDRVREAVEAQGDAVDLDGVAEIAHAELGQAYATAHDRVISELDGERYHTLLVALDRLVTTPPLTRRAAAAAGTSLPRQVALSYDGVRRLVEEADATPAGPEREELLHDARKAAKRSRYAGESVSRVFGQDATVFAGAMEGVQEALGEHQDSVLTQERLRDLALHTSSTGAAFLYGRLHALEEQRSEQSQQHFEAAWKAAGRKSVHRWLR